MVSLNTCICKYIYSIHSTQYDCNISPSLFTSLQNSYTKWMLHWKHYSFFFFAVPFLKHLRVQNKQHFSITHRTVRRMMTKKPMTSRLWYWIQFKSCAATLRWSAPLCLMTNSVQKVASSRGWTGRSRFIWDSFTIFSL